jgi:hypothetical protein
LPFLILLLLSLFSGVLFAADKALVDPLRPAQFKSPVNQAETGKQDKGSDHSSEWRLTAVLIAPDRSIAVIDGRSVRLGEEFEGYKLIDIKPDQVLLRTTGKSVVLRRSGSGLRKNLTERSSAKGSQM